MGLASPIIKCRSPTECRVLVTTRIPTAGLWMRALKDAADQLSKNREQARGP